MFFSEWIRTELCSVLLYITIHAKRPPIQGITGPVSVTYLIVQLPSVVFFKQFKVSFIEGREYFWRKAGKALKSHGKPEKPKKFCGKPEKASVPETGLVEKEV